MTAEVTDDDLIDPLNKTLGPLKNVWWLVILFPLMVAYVAIEFWAASVSNLVLFLTV